MSAASWIARWSIHTMTFCSMPRPVGLTVTGRSSASSATSEQVASNPMPRTLPYVGRSKVRVAELPCARLRPQACQISSERLFDEVLFRPKDMLDLRQHPDAETMPPAVEDCGASAPGADIDSRRTGRPRLSGHDAFFPRSRTLNRAPARGPPSHRTRRRTPPPRGSKGSAPSACRARCPCRPP